MRAIKMKLVESTVEPGLLSIRAADGSNPRAVLSKYFQLGEVYLLDAEDFWKLRRVFEQEMPIDVEIEE